jgi:hypothetical protein
MLPAYSFAGEPSMKYLNEHSECFSCRHAVVGLDGYDKNGKEVTLPVIGCNLEQQGAHVLARFNRSHGICGTAGRFYVHKHVR